MTIYVDRTEKREEDGWAIFETPVHHPRLPDRLYFRTLSRYADQLSEASDAPALALLIPAMAFGEDIHFSTTVSEKLLRNLNGPIQTILFAIAPHLTHVEVKAAPARRTPHHGDALVATGFSAGVDSFCTLTQYHPDHAPQGFGLSFLTYNNVGSQRNSDTREFIERYETLKQKASQEGFGLVPVDSNMDDFFHALKELDFMQTHSIRNGATALLFQERTCRFLYSSAYPYGSTFVGKTRSIGHADPVLLPLLGTESIDLVPVGGELTRVQKTVALGENRTARRGLDVCVTNESGENCSRCEKCLRTLLCLEITGNLKNFSEAFDLGIYKRHRTRYIAETLRGRRAYDKELQEAMKLYRFRGPLKARIIASSRMPELQYKIRQLRHLVRNTMRTFREKPDSETPEKG
ncbi:hypothetical protein [Thioalkalivibrio sp. ALMg11]|uniref:hypothetical protein n=1 Tax=Thioalkalivibrio sp. ALMg11 TaxID=1158165 RepID=UPI0009DA2D01|nr:hypothetical protein [Thioalkalivibrio sp. ALMg11]